MILFFTALSKEATIKTFSCHQNKLEAAFDLLSQIVAQGDSIISAQIIDEDNITELPPQAFDGEPFTEPINKLEKHWRQILNQPILLSPQNHALIDLTHRRISNQNSRIADIDLTINRLDELLKRAEQGHFKDAITLATAIHLKVMISNYQEYASKIRLKQRVAINRLNQLQQ